MALKTMLEINDLHTYYGDSHVLQGVDLSVQRAQVVALLGRNGVGKSTLARSVMGLTPARRGTISFQDRDITQSSPHRIARGGIGYVPQGRQVFGSLTVKEHLEVTARGRGPWTFDQVIDLFPNLGNRLTSLAAKLSGGEQQMLAVARALVGNPAMLIMDEPTEGLAPIVVKELGRTIDSLKKFGTSILLIEQQLTFALRCADTVLIMSKGRIVHRCSPAELRADQAIKARYLGI